MNNTFELLDAVLKEQGISLYAAAKLCGVDYRSIKTTQRRGGRLNGDTIDRLCAGLGITAAEFYGLPRRKAAKKRRGSAANL